jgi:hypothetical protein
MRSATACSTTAGPLLDGFAVLYVALTEREDLHHLTHDYRRTLCGDPALKPFKLDADGYCALGEIVFADHWDGDDMCVDCKRELAGEH